MLLVFRNFELEIRLNLDEPDDLLSLTGYVAAQLGVEQTELPPLEVKKKSIDARRKQVNFIVTIGPKDLNKAELGFPHPKKIITRTVLIIGCGPAGLFCAYELARHGIGSIIIERGKKVRARRPDLKGLTRYGFVNPDSNYCFGEGGAGTYSDGKLYTRSHKRGDVRDVFEILVQHGAPEEILIDARPHIGSNRLPKVVTALREHLENLGVQFEFEARVSNILLDHYGACGIELADGRQFEGRNVVVATGHSARDMIQTLDRIGAHFEAKPFAMGVRIEHPQALINRIQYGTFANHPKLHAASYKLAYTPKDSRGVFSFCMCPGGWIVPASTEADGLVVNGMSLSRRDSPYANSGLVVAISVEDIKRAGLKKPLGGIELQRRIEQTAFQAGGGELCAPGIRVMDFIARQLSKDLPSTSYQPGIRPGDIETVLNASGLPLAQRLRDALLKFEHKMPGYLCHEAVLIGVESRTSSSIRVMRDPKTYTSNVNNLYPCGEGAGYAGGIVSAAMDGMQVARAIAVNKQ